MPLHIHVLKSRINCKNIFVKFDCVAIITAA